MQAKGYEAQFTVSVALLLVTPFAAAVIFNLEYALLAYVGIGAVVLVSRLVYPSRAVAETETTTAAIQANAPAAVQAPVEARVLAKAA